MEYDARSPSLSRPARAAAMPRGSALVASSLPLGPVGRAARGPASESSSARMRTRMTCTCRAGHARMQHSRASGRESRKGEGY